MPIGEFSGLASSSIGLDVLGPNLAEPPMAGCIPVACDDAVCVDRLNPQVL
jgi:hypothetical protein